jgi:hypothetical protein
VCTFVYIPTTPVIIARIPFPCIYRFVPSQQFVCVAACHRKYPLPSTQSPLPAPETPQSRFCDGHVEIK